MLWAFLCLKFIHIQRIDFYHFNLPKDNLHHKGTNNNSFALKINLTAITQTKFFEMFIESSFGHGRCYITLVNKIFIDWLFNLW